MFRIIADQLPRFMACNGSSQMQSSLPPSADIDNTARDEGIAAHYMAATVFAGQLTLDQLIDRKAPNGVYMTADMSEHVDAYIAWLDLNCAPIFQAMEYDTTHNSSEWIVPGRTDFIRFDNHVLRVVDFKYGYRMVEPERNWTMVSHAIGFIANNPHLTVDTVHFDVFQPRPHHPDGPSRRWTISLFQLYQLYNELTTALSQPKQTLATSNHCGGCHALTTCPAARGAEMNSVDMVSGIFTDTIDNTHLSFYLDNLDRALKHLSDRKAAFEELATHRIRNGEIVENYTTDQRLSNTRWKEGFDPAMLQVMTGVDLSKSAAVTPAEAKRRGVNEDVVALMTERVPTGIKLKRVSADKAARRIFKNGNTPN